MKRREFIEKAGCGAAGQAAAPLSGVSDQSEEPMVIRRFGLEIEAYEVGPETRCHKQGEKFLWPKDMGNVCHWLASALKITSPGAQGLSRSEVAFFQTWF